MLSRPFGRDERSFRLRVPEWRAVEKACDAGLGEIAARIAPLVGLIEGGSQAMPGGLLAAIAAGGLGRARLDDVREPILQGLIGGGMSSTEAGALVRHVFDEAASQSKAPMMLFAGLAFDVLAQALIGLEDEPPGDGLGESTAATG
jgi:hypothetical protein